MSPNGWPTTASPPLPNSDLAIANGQEALRVVRHHASEWGIDPKRVGMVGFSAGAMTILQVALRNTEDARPDFIGRSTGR